MMSINNVRKCFKCMNTVRPGFYYREHFGWTCKICAPKMAACKASYMGCTFVDFPSKSMKHELYFCVRSTTCEICMKKISCSFVEHFRNAHANITCRAGERFFAHCHDKNLQLVLTDFGPVVVDYNLTNELFVVAIMTPIRSNCLHNFTCTLQLFDPIREMEFKYLITNNYSDTSDWYFDVSPKEFPDWSGYIEVSLDVNPKNNFFE